MLDVDELTLLPFFVVFFVWCFFLKFIYFLIEG